MCWQVDTGVCAMRRPRTSASPSPHARAISARMPALAVESESFTSCFLGGSVFSKVFGTLFPGEGTIYLKQSMAFMRPMYVDTAYEVRMTVKEVNKEKHRAVVDTIIVDKATGDTVISGEATVMNVERI